MSDRFDQAQALLRDASARLDTLEASYRASLDRKSVDLNLQVGIKGILDNLRSSLDYVARELFDRYGSGNVDAKIYFPIAAKGAKKTDFASLVGKNIPGLTQKRPDMLAILEGIQEFASPANSWLPNLATLSIENKHKNLSPQTRRETKQLRIQSGGVSIQLGQECSISMGPGTSIKIGGMTIPGGQVIQPGSSVRRIGPGTVENIIWVSFEFSDIGKPVLPFLKTAIAGVSQLVGAIRNRVNP